MSTIHVPNKSRWQWSLPQGGHYCVPRQQNSSIDFFNLPNLL